MHCDIVYSTIELSEPSVLTPSLPPSCNVYLLWTPRPLQGEVLGVIAHSDDDGLQDALVKHNLLECFVVREIGHVGLTREYDAGQCRVCQDIVK